MSWPGLVPRAPLGYPWSSSRPSPEQCHRASPVGVPHIPRTADRHRWRRMSTHRRQTRRSKARSARKGDHGNLEPARPSGGALNTPDMESTIARRHRIRIRLTAEPGGRGVPGCSKARAAPSGIYLPPLRGHPHTAVAMDRPSSITPASS